MFSHLYTCLHSLLTECDIMFIDEYDLQQSCYHVCSTILTTLHALGKDKLIVAYNQWSVVRPLSVVHTL